jgi:hypothetical protein
MLCRLLVAQVRQELPDILGDLIANAAKDFFLLLGGTLSRLMKNLENEELFPPLT